MQIAEQQVLATQQGQIGLDRLLDLDDQLRRRIHAGRIRQHLDTERAIHFIAVTAQVTGTAFDADLMTQP